MNTLPASSSLTQWKFDNCVHDTTCVLNKNKFSRWGGLLSFICRHNLQASGQYPGNRNCVRHNKAIIIIIMKICKGLPLKTFVTESAVARGSLNSGFQLSFHTFWHWPPWPAISSPVFSWGFFVCFLTKNALTFSDVDTCSAMFCLFVFEIETWYAFGSHIGHCGHTKSPFCRACKTHDVFLARMDLKMVH